MKTNTCIYVGNLGMYNEGYLVGGWLELPVSEDKLGEFLRDTVKINEYYMEYFFDSCESDLPIELEPHLFLSNIYILNECIKEIENLTDYAYDLLREYLEIDVLRWLVGYINLDDLGKDLTNERTGGITPYGYFEIFK